MSDDFSDTLRHLDRYPGRGDRLDPALVVHAARRRLRARRVGTATGAGALVLALAIAAPAVLGQRTTNPPIGGTTATQGQAPRPVGDAPAAVLTDDIQAVNVPVAAPGGALEAGDVAGGSLRMTPQAGDFLHPGWPGVHLSWWRDTSAGSVGAELTLRDGAPDLVRLAGDAADGGDSVVVEGAVPSTMPNPVTLLSSSVGFDLGDRGTVTTVEVPTFATADGRLLFAVVLRGTAATRLSGAAWQVTFVGSDGKPFIYGCRDVTACALDRLPYDHLAEAQITRFSPAPVGVANELPTTVPAVAVLAPGVWAATGAAAQPSGTVGSGDKISDWWYDLGGTGGVEMSLHVGAADDGGVFAAYGNPGDRSRPIPASGEARFDAEFPAMTTTFTDPHDGYFEAGVLPEEATRAFYVASSWLDGADGTRRYALELPTFRPPDAAAQYVPDRRMYAAAFVKPATDRLFDMESAVVFTRTDGTIVGDGCPTTGCNEVQFSQAYDEIRAVLSSSRPTPCAEFPATSGGGSFEGWWNSSPADAQGNIVRDPALWPTEMREHPRVALVNTDTATVMETWDRIACGHPSFVAAPHADWPPHSVALVDMSTGETIGILQGAGKG